MSAPKRVRWGTPERPGMSVRNASVEGSDVPDNVVAWLRRFETPAKVVVTLVIVVALLSLLDPSRILAAWKDLDPLWLTAALLAAPLNAVAHAGRLHIALRRAYSGAGWRASLRALLVSFAMGAATPGRVGEIGFVFFLTPGGRRRALGATAVMRVYALASVCVLGLVVWLLVPEMSAVVGIGRSSALGIAAAGLGVVVALVVAVELLCRLSDDERLNRFSVTRDLFVGVRMVRPADRVAFVIASWVVSLVYLTQLVWLVRAFGGDVTWLQGAAAGAVAMGFVILVPISIGNIGVREGAVIAAMQHFSVPPAVAFNAAFVLFLINIVIPGLIGIVWNTGNGMKGRGAAAAPAGGTADVAGSVTCSQE